VPLDVILSDDRQETGVDIALSANPAGGRRKEERWTRKRSGITGVLARPRSESEAT